MTKRLEEKEAIIQWIPGVPILLRKSQSYNYTDFLFIDALTLVEMPRKFTFPNMKPYDGTTDPTDHIALYKQRMFIAAIPRDLLEACMSSLPKHQGPRGRQACPYMGRTLQDYQSCWKRSLQASSSRWMRHPQQLEYHPY